MALDVQGTDYLKLPVGTTAQRPTAPASGMIRQNSTTGNPEWYDNVSGTWVLFNQPTPTSAPAFSAYQSSSQSIANGGGFYKVQFQTEEFDTNNCFDNVTNYRFTPTTAGYYQFNSAIGWGANSSSGVAVTLYKNGSLYKIGTYAWNGNIGPVTNLSVLAYANGSSDYFEIYVVNNTSASLNLAATSPYTYFQASMVRSA